jgi:hypothetical protein
MHQLIRETLLKEGISCSFWGKKDETGLVQSFTRLYINHQMHKEVKIYIEFPDPETLLNGSMKVKIFPYDPSPQGKDKFMSCLKIAKENWGHVPQRINEIVLGEL